jgi:hypothetical protein
MKRFHFYVNLIVFKKMFLFRRKLNKCWFVDIKLKCWFVVFFLNYLSFNVESCLRVFKQWEILILLNKILFIFFKFIVMSFKKSSQNDNWIFFVNDDVKSLLRQSKFSFNAWNNLLTDFFKFTISSFSNKLFLTSNKQYVIWNMNTKNEFENWWMITSWDVDTTLRKRKHRKSIWENQNRNEEVWVDWHEVMNVSQDRLYVLCKDCDFATIHFTSSNIENNILIKHRVNNECTTKKEEKNANQKFLQKSF